MSTTFTILFLFLGIVAAFLEQGFDPNAINGFGPGPFNPNAGFSTIPTPSINGGRQTQSGFNPNAGLASTIAPPTFWSGAGNFNPNSGNLVATTSSPPSGGHFGNNWNWGNGATGSRERISFNGLTTWYWNVFSNGASKGTRSPSPTRTTSPPPKKTSSSPPPTKTTVKATRKSRLPMPTVPFQQITRAPKHLSKAVDKPVIVGHKAGKKIVF